MSAPTWSDEFELPDGSYSISDIQDYLEYILKKHSESVDNPSVKIYVNKIENRVEILQLRAKFQTAMVSCSRFIWITNSSDHRRV